MEKVISTNRVPLKLWLNDIEQGALDQALNLTCLPFAFHHVAIMPDSHQGYGMPIGGVLATKGVIIPNAVGVDIGCGMCAVKTSLTEINTDTLKTILGMIRERVPVGFEHHKEAQPIKLMPGMEEIKDGDFIFDMNPDSIVSKEWKKALKSLGTLGGGNHFIEIQKGNDGHIWIMIHSGSRNLGKQVADYYNKIAVDLNKKWHSGIDPKWELAFLPLDSEEGKAYIREMEYCVKFALANRKHMMDAVIDIFKEEFENKGMQEDGGIDVKPGIFFEPIINIAHNYAKLENHFGENVIIHRKGATLAARDTIGIIPGSQGTKSYIVRGKGNSESFSSCSHGAGRKMGRKDAERRLDLNAEIKSLDDMGILHAIRGKKDLDEAPGAYKDIDLVMKNQEDLVEILVELTPLAVVKG